MDTKLMTTNSALFAIDTNNRYFAYGVGQRTCEGYVKFQSWRRSSLPHKVQHNGLSNLSKKLPRASMKANCGFSRACSRPLNRREQWAPYFSVC